MAIHVGAAAPEVPQALLDQLAPRGKMVIPVGTEGGTQSLQLITKDDSGNISKTTICYVRYVPLCDLDHQIDS